MHNYNNSCNRTIDSPPTDIAAKSRNRLRLAFVAALGLLAALLLFAVPVQAQNAPMVTGDATASVPENTLTTTVIKTYMATDADSDPLTWSLAGHDLDDFTLTENAGMTGYDLKFSSSPNYEMPADNGEDNVYNVTVTVTDDESTPLIGTLAVAVTVTDVNEAPVITNGPTSITEAEGVATSKIIGLYGASDMDASTTLTWTLEGADAGDFTITKNSLSQGLLTFHSVPDFENPADDNMDNVYNVAVRVSDGSLGETYDLISIAVTITVTNVNEAPTITQGPSSISKPEGTANTEVIGLFGATDMDASTTLTWTLEGVDAGDFTITKVSAGNSELKFSNVPDYENPADDGMDNIYNVTVKVTDNGSPDTESDTYALIVTVTNVVADDRWHADGRLDVDGIGDRPGRGRQRPDVAVGAGGHGRGDVLEHQRGEQRHVHDRARQLGQVPAGDGVVHRPSGFRQVRQCCAGPGGGRQRRANLQQRHGHAQRGGEQRCEHERRGRGDGQRLGLRRHADLLTGQRRRQQLLHHRRDYRPDTDQVRGDLQLRGQEQLQRDGERARQQGRRRQRQHRHRRQHRGDH